MSVILTPEQSAALVERAAAGDRQAWNRLVDAYEGLIWAIVRRHRLQGGDASDVCQTVWLRLIEHIDRISDPSRVGAWLATTARRECLRVQARYRRMAPVGEQGAFEPRWRDDRDLDERILCEETGEELRAALGQLPPRCQTLLRLLMAESSPNYKQIADALDIPIGSIGPTRGRCLKRLRTLLKGFGIEPGDACSL